MSGSVIIVSDGTESEETTTTVISTIATTILTTVMANVTKKPESSTKYPVPHNWTPPNSTTKPRMGNTQSAKAVAEQTAYGVISCVTVGVLIFMLYLAVFGRRIRATAARWHVINCSLWGILHLISYASFADKAPWPNYITNQNWRETSKQVECLTRSVFPAGMIFVYIEQIILTIAPKLANSIIFNFMFFVMLIPFLNFLMVFLYYAHFMDVDWFYEPSDLFNLVTYVLFVVLTVVYFLWCLFGTCLCCATMTSKKPSSRTTGTFADMWLLLPYGIIPSIMYGPSFGMTSVGFAMKYLLTWVLQSGLLGGGSSSSSSGAGFIDMNFLIQIMTNAILAMPWFVLLFPLVQSVLTLICIRMFREQMFFTLSCGRVYDGSKHKVGLKGSDDWSASVGPPPVYPSSPPSKPEMNPPDPDHFQEPHFLLDPEDEHDLHLLVADFEMADVEDVAAEEEEIEEQVERMEEEEGIHEEEWVSPLSREYTKQFSSDWFGDDRESLSDFAKYYNNAHLSDVNLIVGEETFAAHRLILAKSSDVFDRMLSQRWNGDKKDLEVVEESICQKNFPSFLRFLYCNHVVLHQDNCLPLLILADKYNVTTLKKVCIDFAQSEILPVIDIKELFSVWFSYSTKAYHPSLIRSCMQSIAINFEVLLSEEWEKNWQALDRDQMVEILKCNKLKLSSHHTLHAPNKQIFSTDSESPISYEFKLWEGLVKWIQAPSHPERRGNTSSPLLALILPLIRFPYMVADELSVVEQSPIAEMHAKLFHPSLLQAYKYQALPLEKRINRKEFCNKQFLLRQYDDIRWDRRLTLSRERLAVPGVDHSFTFATRSSTYPLSDWKWNLKLTGLTYSNANNADVLRILLLADEMDQSRAVEYMIQIVDDRKILRSFSGKKTFTKARYSSELEMEKKIEFGDLLNDDSSLLSDGDLILHLVIRPID